MVDQIDTQTAEILNNLRDQGLITTDTKVNEDSLKRIEAFGLDVDTIQKGIDLYENRIQGVEDEITKKVNSMFAPQVMQYGEQIYDSPIYLQEKENLKNLYRDQGSFTPDLKESIYMSGISDEEAFTAPLRFVVSLPGMTGNLEDQMGMVKGILNYQYPDQKIEVTTADKTSLGTPETSSDLRQDIKDITGLDTISKEDLSDVIVYRVGDGKYNVINAPGFDKGDLGQLTRDLGPGVLGAVTAMLAAPAGPGGMGATGAGTAMGAEFLLGVANLGIQGYLEGNDPLSMTDVIKSLAANPAIEGALTYIPEKAVYAIYKFFRRNAVSYIGGKKLTKELVDVANNNSPFVEQGKLNAEKIKQLNQDLLNIFGDNAPQLKVSAMGVMPEGTLSRTVGKFTKSEVADTGTIMTLNNIAETNVAMKEMMMNLAGVDNLPQGSQLKILEAFRGEAVKLNDAEQAALNKLIDMGETNFLTTLAAVEDTIGGWQNLGKGETGISLDAIQNVLTKEKDQALDALDKERNSLLSLLSNEQKKNFGQYSKSLQQVYDTMGKYKKDITGAFDFSKSKSNILNTLKTGMAEETGKPGRKASKFVSLEAMEITIKNLSDILQQSEDAIFKNFKISKSDLKNLTANVRNDYKVALEKQFGPEKAAEYLTNRTKYRITRANKERELLDEILKVDNTGIYLDNDTTLLKQLLKGGENSADLANQLMRSISGATNGAELDQAVKTFVTEDYIKDVFGYEAYQLLKSEGPSALRKIANLPGFNYKQTLKNMNNYFGNESKQQVLKELIGEEALQAFKNPRNALNSFIDTQEKALKQIDSLKSSTNGFIASTDLGTIYNNLLQRPEFTMKAVKALSKESQTDFKAYSLRQLFNSSFIRGEAGGEIFSSKVLLKNLRDNQEFYAGIYGENNVLKMIDLADTMAGVEKRLQNISKSGLDTETYNNIKDVIFGPLDAKRRKIKGVLGLLDQFDRAGAAKYLFDADEFIKRLNAQTMRDLEKRVFKTIGASVAPTLTAIQDIGEEEGKTAIEVSDLGEKVFSKKGEESTDTVLKKIVESAGSLLKNLLPN
jgi:hypothetical protein